MTLATLDRLQARVWKSLPDDLVSDDFGKDDLFASIKVQAADEVHVITDSC